MSRPSPALTSLAWTAELAAPLEATSLAIGRLDARICASSVAKSWQLRAAWTGYATALQLQSIEIDEIDVYVWGCGLALPRRASRSSLADDFATFDPWRTAMAAGGRHWREDLPFTPELHEGFAGAPALLRALELTRQHACAIGTAQPWLALPMLLQRLGVTKTPLPCLVGGDKRFRLATRPDDAMLRRLLKAMAAAADDGLTRLIAMETDRTRAVTALAAERRPGMLAPLLALAQQRPLLAPPVGGDAAEAVALGRGQAACARRRPRVAGRGQRATVVAHLSAARSGSYVRICGPPPRASAVRTPCPAP